jgi:Rrf2 family iron-sulfur cluster assembly transcriptional regulator
LARPSAGITVADIISAVDERVDATRCGGREDCQEGRCCLTHQLWSDLSQQIFSFLEGITLAQFVERPRVREVVTRQNTMHARSQSTEKTVAA